VGRVWARHFGLQYLPVVSHKAPLFLNWVLCPE
jgi:hypothetical protein